ncbi:MAG: DEAD/DEAH box helicase family protein [bacterium]|nr:DEAD/DEAH box helicase family protein [bacterium]
MLTAGDAIQPGLYRLPEADIGTQVLIPGFQRAKRVRGAFGWFTAGWIERLAPGLAEYLNKPNPAQICFTVAPFLYAKERQALQEASSMSAEESVHRIAGVFIDGRIDASALGRHALDCMAWMIATNQLRLRVAVPKPNSNYHPKIWLFDDGTDQVLVRGSANATGRGLTAGVEHMDVDVSWDERGQDRVATGICILDDWENGRSIGIERTLDMPDALRNDIIKTAPESAPTPENYLEATAEYLANTRITDSRTALEELQARFTPQSTPELPRMVIPEWLDWRSGNYAHQGEAVDAWESEPNPERGTIAMATGAGKTLTALICATQVQDRLGNAPLLIVVSAPSTPLIIQWKQEIERFGIKASTPTIASNTNTAISRFLQPVSVGGTHIAVITNNLLCNQAFQNTLANHIQNASRSIATMLIGDEAHTLGSEGFINNKPDFFERRLALSATPERQYDPDGTEEIFNFFGSTVYKFGLDKAIGFCLVPYDYYVHATTLDGEELDQFEELTERIRRMIFRKDDEDEKNQNLTTLFIKRRRIIETATSKIPLISAVLTHRDIHSLKNTLVYASAKNPEQFDNIADILTRHNVRWAPVTQETTANSTLLENTLKTFSEGGYQVLLAKKVLDEGVDIPSIQEAFLVASSTVEREWVQRRGRILRRHPNKPRAILHDFIALPPSNMFWKGQTADKDLKKIVQTELSRAWSFAAYANNATGSNGVLAHLDLIKSIYSSGRTTKPILNSPGKYVIAPKTPKGEPW